MAVCGPAVFFFPVLAGVRKRSAVQHQRHLGQGLCRGSDRRPFISVAGWVFSCVWAWLLVVAGSKPKPQSQRSTIMSVCSRCCSWGIAEPKSRAVICNAGQTRPPKCNFMSTVPFLCYQHESLLTSFPNTKRKLVTGEKLPAD